MPFDKLNYVNVGPQGTFKASGNYQTIPADIDAIFEHLRTQKIQKLTVHFHGGLVDEKGGMEVAEKMAPVYSAARSHPVTFVWETGLLETIYRSSDTVGKTKLFQKLLKKLLKKGMEKLGVNVGGKGPRGVLIDKEIEEELGKDFPFADIKFTEGARGGAAGLDDSSVDVLRQEVQAELEEEIEADAEFKQLLEQEAPQAEFLKKDELISTQQENQKGLITSIKAAVTVAKIFLRVVKRFIRKRDHGFYPTVVEEILRALYVEAIGGWVWTGMKHTAEQMWKPNDGLAGVEMHAGRYFLENLAAHQGQHALTVDLVGHSAGSIAILEMLRAAEEAKLGITIRNVLFLAPACTAKFFHQNLPIAQKKWQLFRMYTMRDDFEQKDRLLSVFYPRSLLYFISGLLEVDVDEPILGMERFLSGVEPFDDGYLLDMGKFVKDPNAGRLALSVWTQVNPSASEGFRTSSQKHTGFDDDTDTQGSLKHLIQQ